MSAPRRGDGGGADGSTRGRGRGRGGMTRSNNRNTPASDDESKARLEARRVRFADGNKDGTRAARGDSSQRARRGRGAFQQQQPPRHTPSAGQTTIQAGMSYPQKYATLKRKREQEREDGIKSGVIADPDRPRRLSEAIKPVGTCPDMCPEFERIQRIVEKDVWGPETELQQTPEGNLKPVPAEHRMVKKFRRAAAGMDEQLPSDLRPPATLRKTVDYLFADLISEAENLGSVHHFLWDRTRAIRNDFSIQQLTKIPDVRVAITCYEQIARFHILSLHQFALAEKPYDQYDSFQERQQLDRTLLSLMQYYDDNRERYRSPNEPEFRAYTIVFQLQARIPDLEDRIQAWPSDILTDRRVQQALKLYHAASNVHDLQGPLDPKSRHLTSSGSWGRFWNLVSSPRTSYLTACVAEIFFGIIRETALRSIWRSYRPGGPRKIEDWIVEDLRNALAFDQEEEAVRFCEGYGFTIGIRADGKRFIDLTSVPGKVFPSPQMGVKDQRKSLRLVEKKRLGRTLTAVIFGLSVREARDKGEVDSMVGSEEGLKEDQEMIEDDRDSLFVKDPHAKTKENGSPFGFMNPGATPFVPQSSPVLAQNPSPSGIFGLNQPSQATLFQPQASPASSGPPSATKVLQAARPDQPSVLGSGTNPSSSFALGPPTVFNFSKPAVDQAASPFPAGSAAPPATNDLSKPTGPAQSIFSTSPQVPPQSGLFKANGGSQQLQQQPPPQAAPQQEDLAAQQQEAEQRRIEEQKRIAEKQRIAEEQRMAEQKRAEEACRAEELRRAEAIRAAARQREAEEAAKREAAEAKKRRKSETYDYLAAELVMNRRDGFMKQFVEFMAGPMITDLMMEWEDEQLNQEADEFRRMKLARKYGLLWHHLSHSLKHRRRGHERRMRIKQARLRRSTGEPLGNSLFTDTLRRTLAESDRHDRAISSEKPKNRRTSSTNGTGAGEFHLKGILKTSVNDSPRPPVNHRRSRTQPSAHLPLGKSTISFADPPDLSASRNMSLGSSTFGTPGHRMSTTKTDYFRLKARGIAPSLLSQPLNRKRNWEEANGDNLYASTQSASGDRADGLSPPRKPFQQILEEDEALFSRVRAVTQAMDESISFFREEREKVESILRSSAASSVTTGFRPGPSMSPSPTGGAIGSSAGSPPRSLPKYYDRVSKFVPREDYGKGVRRGKGLREVSTKEEAAAAFQEDAVGKGKGVTRMEQDWASSITGQPSSFADHGHMNVVQRTKPPPPPEPTNAWGASGSGMTADDAIELD